MPNQGEQLKKELFRTYSKNLELCRPEYKDKYACPLCLTVGFTEETVLGAAPELTIEHTIQDGLGTPSPVLTCAKCNRV